MTQATILVPSSRRIEFFLLLSGYFFYMLRYGTNNDAIVLNLGALQILVAIYAFMRYGVPARVLSFFGIFFLGLFVAQFMYLAVVHDSGLPGSDSEYLYASTRLLVYLFFMCLHGLTIRPVDVQGLVRAVLYLSRFSAVIGLASILLYAAIGVPVLLHFYGGDMVVRVQAFLSEPSAFAPIIGILLIWGCYWRSPKDIVLGISVMLISYSPVAIIGGCASFVIYTFFFRKGRHVLNASMIVFFAVVFYYLMNLDCVSLADSSSVLFKVFGRTSCGLQAVFDPALGPGANQRLWSMLTSIDLLQHKGAMLTGFGLNSSSIFMPELYGDMRENSLWVSILLFYGVFGVFVFGGLCVWGFVRLRAVKEMAVVFVSFLVGSTINSAGGFYLHALVFWMMAYVFSSQSRARVALS